MLYILLIQIFESITCIDKEITAIKDRDSFVFNVRSKEKIGSIKIVRRSSNKARTFNFVPNDLCKLTHTVEENKDGVQEFKHKIEVFIKKDEFLGEIHEIYMYSNGENVLCIGTKFEFEEYDHKLKDMKFFIFDLGLGDGAGRFFFEPEPENISEDLKKTNTSVLKSTEYEEENNLKEHLSLLIDSILKLDREFINLVNRQNILNRNLVDIEDKMAENLRSFEKNLNVTAYGTRGFRHSQNDLIDHKNDLLHLKSRNLFFLEEKVALKDIVREEILSMFVKPLKQKLDQSKITIIDEPILSSKTFVKNEEKREDLSENLTAFNDILTKN